MDSIQRKIAALKAKLAPGSGASDNEREIAKRILAQYESAGHNVNTEEVKWREFPFKGGPRNREKIRFLGVILKNLFNDKDLEGRKVLDDSEYNYELEMTLSEYIEVKARFDFYWLDYQEKKKEHESIFFRAYIGKNDLWAKPDEDEESQKPTEEELEHHMKARAVQATFDRAEYLKRIGSPDVITH
jgi:hypothetical protein